MFVWVLLARAPCGDLYIVGVFGQEQYAHAHASRYLRRHPLADVMIQRFAVIDGPRS